MTVTEFNRNFLVRCEDKITGKSYLFGFSRLRSFVDDDDRLSKIIVRVFSSLSDSYAVDIYKRYRLVFIAR